MSFSGDIKREISRIADAEDYIRLAELIAILRYQDCVCREQEPSVSLVTENTVLAKRAFTLLRGYAGVQPVFEISDKKTTEKNRRCRILISDPADADKILQKTGLSDGVSWKKAAAADAPAKRAYIRGAFLGAGSVSDPGKSYHCEIICPDDPAGPDAQKERGNAEADFLLEQLQTFEIEGKTTIRKGKTLVYLKESTAIVDLLNVIGAHQSLMQMENVRILKEMRNSANRQVNCDNANINKIVQTSGRQIEDIRLIEERIGIESLPENLQQAAEARLAYPEISLSELGTCLDPPVGKSGVNHRMRKIAAIAQKLRESDPPKTDG